MSMLYETILRLCEQRGITGYRLCEDVGISKSTLTDLKMGRKKSLSAGVAAKIADYFGVSVSYLLHGEDAHPPQATPLPQYDPELLDYLEELRRRPELSMLFDLTRNATKEEVEQAVKIIEALRGGTGGME